MLEFIYKILLSVAIEVHILTIGFVLKLECLQHEVVPRFLTDKLLEQNRLKNITPLTANQQFLIARLVWYQDGYEQPSEEDLKRVTQVRPFSLTYAKSQFLSQ